MDIIVKRTGGYAGTEEVDRVNTAQLDPERRKQVEEWARQALKGAESGPAAEPVGADLMRYEITIQDGATKRSMTWVDDGSRTSPMGRLVGGLADLRTQPSRQPK